MFAGWLYVPVAIHQKCFNSWLADGCLAVALRVFEGLCFGDDHEFGQEKFTIDGDGFDLAVHCSKLDCMRRS